MSFSNRWTAWAAPQFFRLKQDDPNVSVIHRNPHQPWPATDHGAAVYSDIVKGDKRILMIDGEPVPYCLARIPASGETRGNPGRPAAA